jgi:hypothetical protein
VIATIAKKMGLGRTDWGCSGRTFTVRSYLFAQTNDWAKKFE